ncbi:MAG: methyltransferase domain-containing protein [Prevotella sp.]|nr:methyltransferase domain-containing protein [Prevotella sp.]
MQQRHKDRKQYFNESAATSRDYYLDYLRAHVTLGEGLRVLEIGCGEGGNLLPFAEQGCVVTGLDLSEDRIRQAQEFFKKAGQEGTFFARNFIEADKPQTEEERFDLVLCHDVIEHIEPPYKPDFFTHIKPFVKQGGIVFFGFPAWQNPFGGHQQISRGLASKLPWLHLWPNPLYRGMLRMSGASQGCIDELMSIKRSRMPVECFERLARETGYTVIDRTLWFINPHYKQKFNLKPRLLWRPLARIPWLRNFYTTSAFYLIVQGARSKEQGARE